MTAVLDASALLALLFREPGWEAVSHLFDKASISTVNISEVLARFARDGHNPDALLARLRRTTVQITEFSVAQAATAARLAPRVRTLGLSLGDRACLALAIEQGLPAITADRAWQRLEVDVDIQLIRH